MRRTRAAIGLIAVIVLASSFIALDEAERKAALQGAVMGSLQEHLLQGSDGPWMGELEDDAYVLSNQNDPGAIFYLYTNPERRGGALRLSVELNADFGENSRAGLIYALDPQGPLYYTLVLDGSGQVSLLRRGPNGLEPRMSTGLESLGPGWHEITLVESGNEIEWRIDGERLGGMGNDEMGRGAVGIVAMGTGTFRFRGFRAVPR